MLTRLKNKKILLGVTGGIAIYKACELVRLLKKQGAQVKVIMTASAMEFIRPLTFRTLSENKVYCHQFEQTIDNRNVEHISLARWADYLIIAPATANCIAKLANGIADDLLSTVALATTAPIALAPAMNKAMWNNPATKANINTLAQRGMKLIGPASGFQACGEIGTGRMVTPLEIAQALSTDFLPQTLADKKIVITAGPTIEPIDPVRYMTNRSSGKMGYAVATAAKNLGAKVVLVSGPTQLPPPEGIKIIATETALQMRDAVMLEMKDCDIFISIAAVANYRVETFSSHKIKKTDQKSQLTLIKNPDILAEVARLPSPPITVGFAAETENLIQHATHKLKKKNVDIIAANQVGENVAFNQEENALTLLTKQGKTHILTQKNKTQLAQELMQQIIKYQLTSSKPDKKVPKTNNINPRLNQMVH